MNPEMKIVPFPSQPVTYEAIELMYRLMPGLRPKPLTFWEIEGKFSVRDDPRYKRILEKVKAVAESLPEVTSTTYPQLFDAVVNTDGDALRVVSIKYRTDGISLEELAFNLWKSGLAI